MTYYNEVSSFESLINSRWYIGKAVGHNSDQTTIDLDENYS